MGPTTYALCQKAIIGPAMWITGMCAFPALFDGVELPLHIAGSVASITFSAPVDKNYQLLLEFEFPSTEARLQDKVVGSNFSKECDDNPASLLPRQEYGQLIPIEVVIRRAGDKSVVLISRFETLCLQSHAENRKWRSIGWVALGRGKYTAELKNVESQEGLANTRTSISLVAGSGK